MKPFVLVDVDTKEIILVIKNVVKRVNIEKLSDSVDFLDEFYRRFKDVNFVSKYNSIDRKQFMDFVDGLKKSKEEEKVVINRRTKTSEKTDDEDDVENDVQNSTLIRSGTERKIYIEDLNMRFDEPFDYYDLAVYDQEKVKKSSSLRHFLERGFLVKTTMNEISKIRSKTLQSKEKEKRERQETLIIERKKDRDDEDLVTLSDDEYRDADSNMTVDYRTNVSVPDTEASRLVLDTFSNNSILDDGEGRSIDELLRRA